MVGGAKNKPSRYGGKVINSRKMQACKPGSVSSFRCPGRMNLIIYLVLPSLTGSSSLPVPTPRCDRGRTEPFMDRDLFGLTTRKVYHAPGVTPGAVSFYLAFSPFPRSILMRGSFFSVALSVLHSREGLPVRKYDALCCPDFPPRSKSRRYDGLHPANIVNYSCCQLMSAPVSFNSY